MKQKLLALVSFVAIFVVTVTIYHFAFKQPKAEPKAELKLTKRGIESSWTWTPVPGAFCRDGSTTGFGVNYGTSSQLMIFMEGGGLCVNDTTCSTNPFHFDESNFDHMATVGLVDGIFNRTNPANPIKTWNFVFIPYCSGDFHAGANVAAIGDSGVQKFTGYANMGLFLTQIIPMFQDTKQVLLTGISAGGFGAALNWPRVQATFGSIPVTLLDDSGPIMGSPYFTPCFQTALKNDWNLGSTILTQSATSLLDFTTRYVKANPTNLFGLIDDTDDVKITGFYGWGSNSCSAITSNILSPVTEKQFTAGLQDIRSHMPSNFGAFIFRGTSHTSLQHKDFYIRTAGGVALSDWVQALINGTITNIGP